VAPASQMASCAGCWHTWGLDCLHSKMGNRYCQQHLCGVLVYACKCTVLHHMGGALPASTCPQGTGRVSSRWAGCRLRWLSVYDGSYLRYEQQLRCAVHANHVGYQLAQFLHHATGKDHHPARGRAVLAVGIHDGSHMPEHESGQKDYQKHMYGVLVHANAPYAQNRWWHCWCVIWQLNVTAC
jgi:hypothetical protein